MAVHARPEQHSNSSHLALALPHVAMDGPLEGPLEGSTNVLSSIGSAFNAGSSLLVDATDVSFSAHFLTPA